MNSSCPFYLKNISICAGYLSPIHPSSHCCDARFLVLSLFFPLPSPPKSFDTAHSPQGCEILQPHNSVAVSDFTIGPFQFDEVVQGPV